jgi:hypothetical protein
LGITDIFGIPKIPKIPKCTTFSVMNSKTNSNFFFQYFIFIPKFGIFGINTEEYRTNTENTKKFQKFFRTFLEKQNFLDSFAENVVHLGIFGIFGKIPKISVFLNFSIEIFLVIQ